MNQVTGKIRKRLASLTGDQPLYADDATLSDDPRSFDDVAEINLRTKNNVVAALQNTPPVSWGGKTLSLEDVRLATPKPSGYHAQKLARLEKTTIDQPVYGTWVLKDQEGNEIDRANKLLLKLPTLTDEGVYYINGIQYSVGNQQRMRSGIYTHRKQNGEIETHFNCKPGGKQFRITFDQEKGRFDVRIGQATLPLLPLYRAVGGTDEKFQELFGDELYKANASADRAGGAKRLAERLDPKFKDSGILADGQSPEDVIAAAVSKMQFSADSTSRTMLGRPIEKIDQSVIEDVIKSQIQLNKGEVEPDSRDAMQFQRVKSAEDIFPEQIAKRSQSIARGILFKLAYRGKDRPLSQVAPAAALDEIVDHVVRNSGLIQVPEATNPTEAADQLLRVTRLGEGAIPSVDSVPDSARAVQPSYMGWIDPIRSPESAKVGVDNRVTLGVLRGKSGKMYTAFKDERSGKYVLKSADDVAKEAVAFPLEMAVAKASGNDTVNAVKDGVVKPVNIADVGYSLIHPSQMFTLQSTLMPGLGSVDGGRVFLGAKFVSQSLPLVHREAPIVRAEGPGGDSYESFLGKALGSITAPDGATVVDASNSQIVLRLDNGEKRTIELANGLPYNRKTGLTHSAPLVKRGERVEAGQVLATSNMTDDSGTLALGTNLRVAYVPMDRKGASNYEDGVIISESAAEKLKADQMYTEFHDSKLGEAGKSPYLKTFPANYSKEQLANIDDTGVIKVGTEVKKGDPLVLVRTERSVQKNGMGFARLAKNRYSDNTITWSHETPGVVKDVIVGQKGISVSVATQTPMLEGDKMAGRHGDKGVVSCYPGCVEIMTSYGWKKISEVTTDDMVLSYEGDYDNMHPKFVGVARKIEGTVDGVNKLTYFAYGSGNRHNNIMAVTGNHRMFLDYEPRRYWRRVFDKHRGLKVIEAAALAAELRRPYSRDASGNQYLFTSRALRDADWQRYWRSSAASSLGITDSLLGYLAGLWLYAGDSHKTGKYRHSLIFSVPHPTIRSVVSGLYDHLNEGTCYSHKSPLSDKLGVVYTASKNEVICKLPDVIVDYIRHIEEHIAAGEVPCSDLEFSSSFWRAVKSLPTSGDKPVILKSRKAAMLLSSSTLPLDETETIPHAIRDAETGCILGYNLVATTEPRRSSFVPGKPVFFKCSTSFQSRGEDTYDIAPASPEEAMRIIKKHETVTGEDIASSLGDDHSTKVYCVEVSTESHAVLVRMPGCQAIWCGNSILPDDQMPVGEDGLPYEVVVNPLGIPSRGNPSQVHEAVLGKIARAKGEPFIVLPHFSVNDKTAAVSQLLKELKMKDTETLTDPVTGAKIPNVFTGVRFYQRLHHLAEAKASGRSDLGPHTQEGAPAKGGEESAPRVGLMEINALLSAGATKVLEDAHHVRGHANEEYWRAIRSGYTPPVPAKAQMLSKFLGLMSSAGINVVREGSHLNIMAATDKDVDAVAAGEITSGDTVKLDTLNPIKGGLFDRAVTGGHGGDRYGKIELGTSIPNPTMEPVITKLLGIPVRTLRDTLAYKAKINGESGPEAIKKALDSIDVEKESKRLAAEYKTAPVSKKDDMVRKMQYLRMFKQTQLKPSDLMISKMLVLPPNFRPISKMGEVPLVNSINLAYKDLFDVRDAYNKLRKSMGKEGAGDAALTLYDAAKAVVGVGEPISVESQNKGVKGLLKQVFGTSPKLGMYQRKLMSTTVNLGSRGVITPDPRLTIDQVGLPEEMAWSMYSPFISRKLVKGGMTPVDALQATVDRDNRALDALKEVITERPVILNRAPSLHRYSIMGAWPVLTKGRSLRLPPAVTASYNADFDGDAMLNFVILVIKDKDFENFGIDTQHGITYTSESREQLLRKEVYMSGYLKTKVVGVNEDDRVFLVNLEDFPRTPGCVTKDHIDFHGVPAGCRVIAIDEASGRAVAAAVSGWSIHRDLSIEIVTLSSGRQIVTDDDPRAVYGIDIDPIEWTRCRPADASNMLVPVMDKTDVFPETITKLEFNGLHNMKSEVRLTQPVGHLLGLLIGDGWVSTNGRDGKDSIVCLASSVEKLGEVFETELAEFATIPVHVSRIDPGMGGKFEGSKGCDRYAYYSQELSKVIKESIGHTAGGKHLPPFVWAAPREFKLGVLAGIWDSDGSISMSHGKKKPQWMINFSTVSIRLAQEIQHLLRTFGVASTITSSKTPAGSPCWVLNVSTPDAYDHLRDLKLSHPERSARFAEFFASEAPDKSGAYSRFRLMPMPKWLASLLTRHILNKDDRSMYSAIQMAGAKGHISKEMARKIVARINDLVATIGHPKYAFWKQLVEQDDFHFERVVNVEKTGVKEDGYDLTVPGYETFMSIDGIVLSNTMSAQVPASQEAVEETIAKLMPSRSLLGVHYFNARLLPRQEFQFGLFEATRKVNNEKPKHFATVKEAKAAFRRGEITVHSPVIIDEQLERKVDEIMPLLK